MPNTYQLPEDENRRDRIWKRIALDTEQWAYDLDCRRHDGEILNFFQISSTRKNPRYPLWSQNFTVFDEKQNEINASDAWRKVMFACFSEGLHLSRQTFEGYYFGIPGDEAWLLANTINNMLTRQYTLYTILGILRTTEHWDVIEGNTPARLQDGWKDKSLSEIAKANVAFLQEATLPLQISIGHFLLTSNLSDDEGDAA